MTKPSISNLPPQLAGMSILDVADVLGEKRRRTRQEANEALAAEFPAWLAAQSDAARADIFVFIEARANAAQRRKLGFHPLRPVITAEQIEAARADIQRAKEEERAEMASAQEEAKRKREADAAAREQTKAERERAQLAKLLAKHGSQVVAGQVADEGDNA